MGSFPHGSTSFNANRLRHADPLENPRRVYWQHYDEESLAGRWGAFLARVLRLKPSDQRWIESMRRNLRENRDGTI